MKPVSGRTGFTLVEVTLAIGIAAFGLLTLLGLLATGLNTVKDGFDEERATDFLSMIGAEIRNTPVSEETSRRYGVPVWGNGAAQSGELALDRNGQPVPERVADGYRIRWKVSRFQPGSGNGRLVHLRIEWPALAQTPTGYVEEIVVLAEK